MANQASGRGSRSAGSGGVVLGSGLGAIGEFLERLTGSRAAPQPQDRRAQARAILGLTERQAEQLLRDFAAQRQGRQRDRT